jgi:hypothetical protein
MVRSADDEASIAAASLARQRQDALARSAKEIFPDIDVLCTVRHLRDGSDATSGAAREQYKSKPNRFGKRKPRFDSPYRPGRADLPDSVYFA